MAKAVTGKAATYCIFGSRPSVLLVPDGHDIQLNGNNRANVSDRIPIANIFPFGLCCSPFNPAVIAAFGIPQPCLPLTPLPWYPGNDTIILEGEKGLDDTCLNCCIWRGIIFFLYAGQDKWNVSDAVPPSQAADASKLMTEKIEAFKQTPEGQAMLAKAEADYTEMMAVHDALCPSAKPAVKTCTNGEPVNVVNGQELLQQTDFSIPGLIPFTWTRTYRSGNSDKNFPVGFGWSVKYGDYIKTGIKKTVYVDSEGREIPFDTPEVGKTFKNMYELATLSRPDKESYEILFDDGRRLSFTGDKNIKHLISEKDIYGNSLDFTYNKKNQLESVFSSGIKVASFKFDKNNRISSISRVNRKGKEFQAVKYDYSKQGDLIKVTDACGKSESFEYENHLFTKRTLKTGFNFYFTWDKYAPDGKCLRSFGDDNIFDTKFKYFPEERYTEVTDGRGITRTYCYDRMENIRKYIDGKGGVTTYVYDGRDNPVIVTDPEGSVKTTLYNEFGSISKTVDPEGTETDFKYNEKGQLAEIVGPNESTAKREYNETGDLIKSTAPDGSETHYKYNSSGLPVKISDHFGNSKTMVWDEFGRLISEMDESGNKTQFAYDDLGNLALVTDIDGTTDYTYDPMGRILTITDPLKRVTKLSYNEYGEHETVIDPYGDKRTYIYNGLSKVVSETDPNGKTTTFLYDKEMNVVETVTTAGSEKYTQVNGYDEEENIINTEIRKNGKTALSESCEYDKAGNMLLYTDGNVTEKYKYDKAGRKIKQTVKIGDEETANSITYFEDGNLETLKGPEETVTSFEYDKTGRPAKITVPDGTFYENKYSLAGPEEQKDRLGRKNLYTYNSKGRVETVTNPNGEITEYTYNAAGQITKLTDANGNSTFWEYDRKGRVTDKSFSNGSRLTYEYNKKGQLSKKTDAEGKTVEYNYDERDRLSKITYSKDEPVEFKYNSKGALVSMSDASGKTLFDHDATGRLVNVNGPLNDDSVSYTYDDLGRKQEMKLNGVTMSTYSYDELGRISKVTAGENLYEYKYKLLGSDIESVSRNGKLLIKKEFDKLGRTKKQFEYFSDGEPLADNHYFYNNADMMTARIDTNDITAQFQYDMAGRLAEVEKYHDTGYMKRTFPLSESYFYDKMGNREKAVTQYNHSEFNYKNNSLNQYTVFSDNMNRIMHTAYDQNGNMTKIPLDSETTMVCEYDGENRLSSIRKQNTKIINTYDGFGRRKIKEVYAFNDRAEWIPQTRTEFIYDGWNLISERKYKTNNLSTLGDQQPTTSHYFWGLDVSGSLGGTGGVGGLLQLAVGSNSPYITKKEEKEPGTEIFGPAGSSLQSSVSSLQSGCSIYFPHYDHIGNIIAYTNEREEVAAVYDYSGFGELIRSDGPMKEDFSLQFSTKYIDKETNLYYYGYRFYNPQMGNWLSREPMGESESVNLYTFINNDSINAIDILGDKIYVVLRPLTAFTKTWSGYFPEGGTFIGSLLGSIFGPLGSLFGGAAGAYTGQIADYYRNKTWHGVLVVADSTGCNKSSSVGPNGGLVDFKKINPFDTWDFQASSIVGNPAADWDSSRNGGNFPESYYKGRVLVQTIVNDDSMDKKILNVLKNEPRFQKYILGGSKRYNCCDWITRVLDKVGIDYKAPNPQPFGDMPTPNWVPSKKIGKIIDLKYKQKLFKYGNLIKDIGVMKYLLFALIAITILIVLCFLTKNFFFTMKDNTKTNTIVIPTGLRFKTTEVKLLDRYFTTAEAGKVQNLSIVFAKSSYRSGVQSYDINIESGYIKFITIDGYIKFLPNNIVKAKGKDPISEVTVQYRNNDNNIIIGTGGVGMNLVGIIKPKNFIYNHKGANNLIGQKLPSVQDDNKVTLDLKIELSDDFRGFINNWKVEPNWL